MIAGTLAWVGGMVALQLSSELPSLQWVWLSPLLLLGLRTSVPLRLPAIALLGALWALVDAHWVLNDSLPLHLETDDLTIVGRVVDLPQHTSGRLRFLYRVEELQHNGISYPSPGLIRLSWYGGHEVPAARQRWQLTVRLKASRGFSNPGGFDYEAWLYRNEIRATGYVRNHPGNRRLEDQEWMPHVDTVRESLVGKQDAALRGNEFKGLIRALTLGDRSGVSNDQWRILRQTGTSHLLAISGLHIGILAALAFLVVRMFWSAVPALSLRIPALRAASGAALVAATGYAALAGFSLPTQRALIMVAVFMLGAILQRTQRPVRSFVIALLLVSAYDPKAVLSPGFWLSFGAVAIILTATVGRRQPSNKWRWVSIQWALALGLAPLLIGFFGQISLVAPLANLVAIPWTGFAVAPVALLGTAAVALSDVLGGWLLTFAAWLLQGQWELLSLLNQVPFAFWRFPLVQPLTLVVAALGVVLLIAPRGVPLRYLGVLMIIPTAWYSGGQPLAEGAFRVTLLDVGQGLSVVIRTRNHTLLYDTGPRFSDRFDTGEAVVVPYLRGLGIGRLDRMVLSHGDNDHAGGADSVRRGLSVESELRAPRAGEELGAAHCRAGMSWYWDGVQFTVLHPDSGYSRESEENNHSCVLEIRGGEQVALLTGDIEHEAETELIRKYGSRLAADLLVVPHHGSESSSTQGFLETVQPKLALVGCGYKNRWSFPAASVLQRYRALQVPVMSTADWGAIEVDVDPQAGISAPRSWRKESRRYWHAAFGGDSKSSNIAPLVGMRSAEQRVR